MLPSEAVLTIDSLTCPDDLLFDTAKGGTLVVQNCIFNGGQSGYPQAGSISYINNRFEFTGTLDQFYTHNAYPVWYKSTGDLDFLFQGNTVIGPRGVHIETRGDGADAHLVNIDVHENHFVLSDPKYDNKTIALQLVKTLSGNVSFQDNYVDAYMAICFFDGIVYADGTLSVVNNYLTDGCKLYGSNEWGAGWTEDRTPDGFAREFLESMKDESCTIDQEHTQHHYKNGICTICGEKEPYAITIASVENGTVTASVSSAAEETTVTLTVTPNEGYTLDTLTVTSASGSVTVTPGEENTYTFTMPGEAVTVSASFVVSELPFTDLLDGAWYHDAVRFVYYHDLMQGTGETAFSPNNATTRAMAVLCLYRMEGSPVVTGEAEFDDVADGLWYSDAIDWAVSVGIVNGITDSTFAPDRPVTREQLAVMFYRYASYRNCDMEAEGDLSSYSDADTVSGYAQEALQWSNEKGILLGVSETRLAPLSSATRAQFATMLMRFSALVGE